MPAALEVVRHTLDGLVRLAQEFSFLVVKTCRRSGKRRGRAQPFAVFFHQAEEALQEAVAAFHPGVGPFHVFGRRPGEHLEQAGGGAAVFFDHFVRRNYVPPGFRHFGAVFVDHALVIKPANRLIVIDQAEVAHHFGPEAGVDKVEHGMLRSADVLVNRKEVVDDFGIEWLGFVPRAKIPVEVPSRVHECVHGVGFAPCRAAALRASRVDELLIREQR